MTTAQQRWVNARGRLIVVIARCQSCAGYHEFSPGWSGAEVILEGHIPGALLSGWCQHAYQCPASPDPQVRTTFLPRMGHPRRHESPSFGAWGPERPWSPI